MEKQKRKYWGDFEELQDYFESALARTLFKNEDLSQEQKEQFALAYEEELDNGPGFTLYEK